MKKASPQFEIVHIQTARNYSYFNLKLKDMFGAVFIGNANNFYVTTPLGSLGLCFGAVNSAIVSGYNDYNGYKGLILSGGPHMIGGPNGAERTEALIKKFDDGRTFIPDWDDQNTVFMDINYTTRGYFPKTPGPEFGHWIKPTHYAFMFKCDSPISTIVDTVNKTWGMFEFYLSKGEISCADKKYKDFLSHQKTLTLLDVKSPRYFNPYPEEAPTRDNKSLLPETEKPKLPLGS